ncbi:hypothetical protein Scep_016114 [Stephania cephalantha]|uniref:Pmr5/Cas1p GDSL/SGNH-like acyl-esterase family protein n=1 Tax=Stephania cephalantha TaxID=152367 RepID=A0AAP0INQ6_9MAGN
MVGAVQFGVLAACVVLFVPMGLAGYHLSRNKMLFFSGALFITLAVGVHLTPYFPSISSFFISSLVTSSPSSTTIIATSITSTSVGLDNRKSCISFLHEISWDNVKEIRDFDEGLVAKNGNLSNLGGFWDWEKSRGVIKCGFQKLGRSDASDLLNGSWIVVVGDSQARLVVVSLLELMLDRERMEAIRGDLFKRHSDYRTVIEEVGVKLDFVWAPYVSNCSDLLGELKRDGRYPDVLVVGSGLWHMLHVTSPFEYGLSLRSLRRLAMSLISEPSGLGTDGSVRGSLNSVPSPHMFWLGMPTLINSMLNTEEKRKKMSVVMQNAYERELHESKLLSQYGGPFLLLDVRSLCRKCGSHCTVDGMHYDGSVYQAAIHVMLNALLIESQQRL